MKREESKKDILSYCEDSYKWEEYTKTAPIELIEQQIDKIYDYFESRTCSSCKHLSCNGICVNIEDNNSIDIYATFGKDFACNKWEPKKE